MTSIRTHVKNYVFTVLAFTSVCLYSSCSKDSEDCNETAPPITVTKSVAAGGDIELKVANNPYAQFYHWEGPNGFISEEQNPVLTNVQTNNAGRYTLRVGITGGCIVEGISDSVIVTVPAAPCSPGVNQGNISGAGAGAMSFYSVTCGPSGGSYFMDANSSAGDLELEFSGTGKPADGVYSIQPLGGSWVHGNVRVRFVANSSNWPSASGKVYVKNTNNKISATFCNIPVSSQTYVFSTTASGNVTEK
jgi:hypothetical protein